MSTKCPSKRDSDIDWGSREVGDLGSGSNSVADFGKPGIPSHHWRADDDFRECVGWDLLWVGLDDVGVGETIAVAM